MPDSGGLRPAGPETVSQLVIRPFVASDQDAVRRLILTGLGEHFGFIDESLNPDLSDIARTYIGAGHLFVVAELGQQLVGTGALVDEEPAVGRLVRMSVDITFRRAGIGRALVEHLVVAACNRGCRRVVLETNADWPEVIRFYKKCGFSEYQRTSGDVHLKLKLNGPPAPAVRRDFPSPAGRKER